MNITVNPFTPNGRIKAISSKSAAHRLLICAAFADGNTVIRCDKTNNDITATADCLRALGADIRYEAPFFFVKPIDAVNENSVLECGESGSTLRFLLPIIPALGINASFSLKGRLPDRPLSPLYEELTRNGAHLSDQGSNPLTSSGKLTGKEYKIRGDVSSQFISGLLFALTVSRLGGKLIIEGKTESEPYINMTVDALSIFGAKPIKTSYGYLINENSVLKAPPSIGVEGDWSNAAFPLCMGAVGNGKICVYGLNGSSYQGDRAIIDILKRMGADITEDAERGEITVNGGAPLHGICIDASQIPDLVPVLATVAATAEGETEIYGAARLRLKESDRLETVSAMLGALGASVIQTDGGLIIHGKRMLDGGTVNACNDHRIAMSAAVAAVRCTSPVTVIGAECASKSYPDFWNDLNTIKS